jgi:SET family sugar efflux transporter-like MFS transporter
MTATALAGILFSQLNAHVRDTFVTRDGAIEGAGLSMSVVRVCFSFAWTVGPAIGAWILAGFGFRGLFLGAATLNLLFLGGVVIFVPSRARSLDAAVKRLPVWRVLASGDMLVSFAAFAAVFAAHAINMMNLPLTVTTLPGGTERDLGIIFGIGPIVEIPLMLWFGHLATARNQLRLIRFGAAVTVFYFLALSLARAPWHLYLAQILSGVSFAILTNVAILFFQEMIPGQAGLATAVFSNAARLGSLLGFIVFGAAVEDLGHRGTFLLCAVLTVVTFVLLMVHRAKPAAADSEATLHYKRA